MIRLVLLAFSIALAGCGGARNMERLGRLEGIPARPFSLDFVMSIQPVLLGNGLKIYVIEDHELPTVRISAIVKAGSIYDPPGAPGLAAMTAQVMRTGGAGARSAAEVDEALDFMASTLSAGADEEGLSFSMSSLKENAAATMDIFADVLLRPRFEEDRLRTAREQALEALRRQDDHPGSTASREFRKLIYGPESPWARTPEAEQIRRIRRRDLVDTRQNFLAPNNLTLIVSGDAAAKDLLGLVERRFGRWEWRTSRFPSIPPVTDRKNPPIRHIQREASQSQIIMGHLGYRRHDPNEFTLGVLSYILGEGAGSRLNQEIRNRRGLAYSVGASLTAGMDRGLFAARCGTRPEQTYETFSIMRNIITGLAERPDITEAEVAAAKQGLVNSFIFNFTSRFGILSRRAFLDFLGYPADYLAAYVTNVQQITAADVNRAARQYLRPAELVTVIVGDARRFERPVAEFLASSPSS